MKKSLIRLTLLLVALLVASAGQARPPLCTAVCCDGTASPTTQCIGAGGILAQCGPPYAYICP